MSQPFFTFNNEKFKEIISLIKEMYDHSNKRINHPNEESSPDGWTEGQITVSFSFLLDPYSQWNSDTGQIMYAVYYHTNMLERREETTQRFQDIDHLYDQVKIWHRNEMQRDFNDKTIAQHSITGDAKRINIGNV